MRRLSVLLFVALLAIAAADRKPTIAEKLKEDADLSQVQTYNFIKLSFVLKYQKQMIPLH